MFNLFFTFAPLAFAAVIGQGSISPKVNKAVDSILMIVQNELHHAVNEAVLSVAETDGDLIQEMEKIKEKAEKAQLNAEEKKINDDETLDKKESNLKKRWYGYG
jgi:deoxyxylulose-5-phosphate synthase